MQKLSNSLVASMGKTGKSNNGKQATVKGSQKNLMMNTLSKADYSFFYENSVWENYEDLVYAISRGYQDDAIKLYKELKITVNEEIRPVSFICTLKYDIDW